MARKIAITGNIGTGKSTVTAFFKELGLPVINADEIVHDLMKPHSHTWKILFEHFGSIILGKKDHISGENLARIIFSDKEEKRFLEKLLHPKVKEEIEIEISKLTKHNAKSVIIEVPLLFEVGWEDLMDVVIVVTCEKDEQLKRCKNKFAWDEETLKLAMDSQIPMGQKIDSADYTIDNSASIDKTQKQVEKLINKLGEL
ncbi:MAG: dephospho-CoA kinase [Pseudomonadota bacterium]